MLGATFVLLDGLALSTYSRFGARRRRWLGVRGRRHWEGRVTGSLLVGAGPALAAKR